MIFLSLIVCVALFYWAKPKKNLLLDPLTLFFVGILYYGFFIPVSMVFSGSYYLPFSSGILTVSEYDITVISFLLPMGYLGFILGYRVFTPRSFVDDLAQSAGVATEDRSDISGLVLGLTFAIALFLSLVFFTSDLAMVLSGYEQKIQARYEGSVFSLVYNIMLAVAATTLAWKAITSASPLKIGISAIAALFVWSLLTFSKEPMVYAALVMFAMAAKVFPERQSSVFVGALFGGIFLLLFFVPAFSIYRATGELTFVMLKDVSLPFLFSDASGPFSALILSIRNEAAVYLGPLVESFVLWIPRGLWESRPLDAAEDFARAVMSDWQPGHGLGFSPFAEAKLRFGVLLSPLLLFLSGLSISGFQRWALRLVSPSLAPALLLVVQGYLLFTFHRGSFSGIFTSLFQFWFPFLGITVILNALLRPKDAA